MPTGGTTGQALVKTSAADYATNWQTISGGALSWPLMAPDGSPLSPQYTFLNSQTTGLFRDGSDAIGFATNGLSRWRINGSGHLVAPADNTYDIGASGATRPRDLFLGRNLAVAGYQDITENATPGNPAAGTQRLYARSGELYVRDSTGIETLISGLALPLTTTLTFSPDNTVDVGNVGNLRPRDVSAGRNVLVGGYTQLAEIAAPTTPSASQVKLYAKSDHKVYSLDSTGLETALGGGGAGLTLPLGQTLTFSPDNTYDIGATATTRPRNIYLGGTLFGSIIDATTIGPSANQPLGLRSNNIQRWRVDANGHFIAITDNTLDIGASGATRPRDLWLGRNLSVIGTSLLTGTVSVGANATPPVIRAMPNNTLGMMLESPQHQVTTSGKNGFVAGANAYYDGGANWNRYDVAQPALVLLAGNTGFSVATAPAGANPISALTTQFSINNAGVLSLPNGSVTTPMLAANAATTSQMSNSDGTSYTLNTINTPTILPGVSAVTVNSASGGPVLVYGQIYWSHPTQNANIVFGYAIDGSVNLFSPQSVNVANVYNTATFAWLVNCPAGSHTFQLAWQTAVAGLVRGAWFNQIVVVELKR